MHILWMGDAGSNTGFARVTDTICRGILAQRDDLRIDVLAVNFRGELPTTLENVKFPYKLLVPTVYNTSDLFGISRIKELILKTKYDAIIILNDVPVIREYMTYIKSLAGQVPWIPPIVVYTPIDSYNMPSSWSEVTNSVDKVITYTEVGKKELIKCGTREDLIKVAPHGNSDAFYKASPNNPAFVPDWEGKPIGAWSRDHIKAAAGMEGQFMVLWADRNSERKNLPGFLRAVAPLMHKHEDMVVWLHCYKHDVGGNVQDHVETAGLLETGRVYITPNLAPGLEIPDWHLNAIYNHADLKVSSSLGEGWGLTNVEALQAGTPVITLNSPINEEVFGPSVAQIDAGWTQYAARGGEMYYPSISHMTELIEHMYNHPGYRDYVAEQGLERVKRWNWDDSIKVFLETLDEVA